MSKEAIKTLEEHFVFIKQIADYYKTIKDAEDFLTTEEFWERVPFVVVYRMAELIRLNKVTFEVLTPPFI